MFQLPLRSLEQTFSEPRGWSACSPKPPRGYPPDSVVGALRTPMLARLEKNLPRGDSWRYEGVVRPPVLSSSAEISGTSAPGSPNPGRRIEAACRHAC